MTEEQRLEFLESIEAMEILKGELPLYYDIVNGAVHLPKNYESIMKLYDLPYRLIEDKGRAMVAMPINDSTYKMEVPGEPRSGCFCFSDQTVYPNRTQNLLQLDAF